MDKRYMLFINEKQVAFLKEALESALDYAIKTGNKELMVVVSGLLDQVKNPRELKPKSIGWGGALRSQLLGR